MLSDDKIRNWLEIEKIRLGEHLDCFEIVWDHNAKKTRLEIWSQAKPNSPGDYSGRSIVVEEVIDLYAEAIGKVREDGKQLYYRLRKDFPIQRNLGGK